MSALDRAAACWRRCGRLTASKLIQQIIGPLIRHDYAAQNDEEERQRAPESNRVVPVPVARPSLEIAAKPDGGADVPGGPLFGKPKVNSADNQTEEQEIADARYGMAEAVPDCTAQSAMKFFCRAEKSPRIPGSIAES